MPSASAEALSTVRMPYPLVRFFKTLFPPRVPAGQLSHCSSSPTELATTSSRGTRAKEANSDPLLPRERRNLAVLH